MQGPKRPQAPPAAPPAFAGAHTSRPATEYTGDPACWLDRVCSQCGALAEDAVITSCARCGNDITKVAD